MGQNTLVGDYDRFYRGSRRFSNATAYFAVEMLPSMWRTRSEATVADLTRCAFRIIAVAFALTGLN